MRSIFFILLFGCIGSVGAMDRELAPPKPAPVLMRTFFRNAEVTDALLSPYTMREMSSVDAPIMKFMDYVCATNDLVRNLDGVPVQPYERQERFKKYEKECLVAKYAADKEVLKLEQRDKIHRSLWCDGRTLSPRYTKAITAFLLAPRNKQKLVALEKACLAEHRDLLPKTKLKRKRTGNTNKKKTKKQKR